MTDKIKYLTKDKKDRILELYLSGIKIQHISERVDEPKIVVKEYLKQEGFYIKYKYFGEVHGHIQYTDYYSAYEHQFVMSRELKVDISIVKMYYVHHSNGIKTDNQFNNLWLFYDNSTHQYYHALYNRGEIANNIDSLYMFCINRAEDYLSDIERDRAEEVMFNSGEYDTIEQDIRNYIALLKKVYKKQKKLLQANRQNL